MAADHVHHNSQTYTSYLFFFMPAPPTLALEVAGDALAYVIKELDLDAPLERLGRQLIPVGCV